MKKLSDSVLLLFFLLLSVTAWAETETFFAGTDQEVRVHYVRGREPGPVLLIFGGVHGDESAGYLTVDRYADIGLRKGTLILAPRLNLRAVLTRKRTGYSGDMNRMFAGPPPRGPGRDAEVVSLAQSLIGKADCVLNLHQGTGFYSPTWINKQRNPLRWGQCNVIDAPVFDLAGGERLELEHFADRAVRRANTAVRDSRYHFHTNNTDTGSAKSRHKEQRRSLTYYALTKGHKMAFGLESTKNCTDPQAVAFLTIAVNAVIKEMGIIADTLPSEDPAAAAREIAAASGPAVFEGIEIDIGGRQRLCRNGETIILPAGESLKIIKPAPLSLAGRTAVDVKGFAGNLKCNDGNDLGYKITAASLLPKYALDAEKTRYRIEVKAGRLPVGELFLHLEKPEKL